MDKGPIGKEFAYAELVYVKRISGKRSYNIHTDKAAADRQVRRSLRSQDAGRPYRFMYRVLVYAKYCR